MEDIVIENTNREDIAGLHLHVFDECLSDEKWEEKASCGRLECLFCVGAGEKLGYAILQDRSPACHIWYLGILRQYRGKGFGKSFLEALEAYTRRRGFKTITLSTNNSRRELLALTIKRGYRIYGAEKEGSDVKIRLEKTLKEKNELRFLLTSKCNYRCIFCHGEGVTGQSTVQSSVEEKLKLLVQAVKNGYDDITITGGEPLLCRNELIELIDGLKKSFQEDHPRITLVTNGILMDESVLEVLERYPGDKKVHISLHSFEPEKYDQITGTQGNLSKVLDAIKEVIARNISLKVNVVLLRGINGSSEEIAGIINKACSMNIPTLKMLELLITRDNEKNFRYFLSADEVEAILAGLGYEAIKRYGRGASFINRRQPGFNVEISRLTCKLGCARCPSVRDRTIGSDLRYYPCFVHSEDNISLPDDYSCSEAFEKGDLILRGYGEKFGKDSPILIAQEEYIKGREVMNFETPLSFDECRRILESLGFIHQKSRDFTYHFWRPRIPGENWLRFEKQLKFGFDASKPSSIEFIYSSYLYVVKSGFFTTSQTFLDDEKPPHCKGIEKARRILNAIDFEEYMIHSFSIYHFHRDGINLTLDRSTTPCNIQVAFKHFEHELFAKLINELGLKTIDVPFTRWLMGRQQIGYL